MEDPEDVWPPGPEDWQGNINHDPCFIDADGHDDLPGAMDDNLRLSAGSPCINGGDNTAVPPDVETDLDGNPRTQDWIVDMGAYEAMPPCCPCPGDMNNDGFVDAEDVPLFKECVLAENQDSSDCLCADVNNDGQVDGSDWGWLIERLGRDPDCGSFNDYNGNGVPDRCDIANGTSSDENHNGIPDECETPDGGSPRDGGGSEDGGTPRDPGPSRPGRAKWRGEREKKY